jgi:hypothetical protein
MPITSKLKGLAALIEQLKKQNPELWRLIVFTTSRETQTTIQNFLEQQGIKVGIINGDSGLRNQETIAHFRANPPRYRVIVSTEAGSEGVNLQIANVLVNYDLPWNPMIVEQRIGRVQRLASDFKRVTIFNMTLRGTFEDYIVGRLMEKLQMAANAIGDIDAMLQGSDIADGEEDGADKFEDRILKLVLDALAGKNVEEAVRLDEKSIEDAQRALEESNIDELLGQGGGSEYVGPKAPKLRPVGRSMDVPDFTLAAFEMEGARVAEEGDGVYLVHSKEGHDRICFEAKPDDPRPLVLYDASAPPFQRLVKRTIASGVHNVNDADPDPRAECEKLASQWAERVGATLKETKASAVTAAFTGNALLRVRATVAHDSYEQLISCCCEGDEHQQTSKGDAGLSPVERIVRDPAALGIDIAKLSEAGERDEAITEFCRFYEERRQVEVEAAGSDARKRQKLSEDFTPRLDMSLVGLEGEVRRDIAVRVRYGFASGGDYESHIVVRPGSRVILRAPETDLCIRSGHNVPTECLGECGVSGAKVLKHLLVKSEFSDRVAQPEFMENCELTGKRALPDELEQSTVTGRRVASTLLKQSAVSGARAEPEHFGMCAFSNAQALNSELAVSELSGKPYRTDQSATSTVSGKAGHVKEFTICYETRQTIARSEAETCEVSGKVVRSGMLETCIATGKKVLPSLLAACQVTGARAQRSHMVTSSVSSALMLRDKAVQSSARQFCLPAEAQTCLWSGRRVHPDDIRPCSLTGLPIHIDYATTQSPARLRPLVEMLDGIRHNADQGEIWDKIAQRLNLAMKGGKCRIKAAILSPSNQRLATCAESKTMLGLRVHQVGAVYDLA